ncbi:hypothetical protein ACFC5H_10030 [Streptomyces rochei]|uniref:hypothetical protein n=1 Tax=Streptomyces TaxID=1883 RepID=UPI0034398E6A
MPAIAVPKPSITPMSVRLRGRAVEEEQERCGQSEAQCHHPGRSHGAGKLFADGLSELDAQHAAQHQRRSGKPVHGSRLDARKHPRPAKVFGGKRLGSAL